MSCRSSRWRIPGAASGKSGWPNLRQSTPTCSAASPSVLYCPVKPSRYSMRHREGRQPRRPASVRSLRRFSALRRIPFDTEIEFTHCILAAAIGRETPRRDQERNMIVAFRLGDEELDRDRLQKRRIGSGYLARSVVVADFETQLITADRDRTATDQWRVGAAVRVRRCSDNQPAATVISKFRKRQGHALCRTAIMVIQDMGRQAA